MDKILILDFGGQYNQLIARRVRECNVYCEVKPYTMPLAEIRAFAPKGIIFTGGPHSVYAADSPQVDPEIFALDLPILGICYGCQLMAQTLGGRVTAASEATAREFGKTNTYFSESCKLFAGLPAESITWMSHGDYLAQVPEGFQLVAHTDACPTAAIADESRGFYGVQFHPEVNHTAHGQEMLRNFLYAVCQCDHTWTMRNYMKTAITDVREKVGDEKVLLALSGGVDSSVAAALLAKAVGERLTCIFVDHGLLRKNEGDEVEAAFRDSGMHFIRVNAQQHFMERLAGVEEPERKRKIIGEEFIHVFEAESKKIGHVDFLAQGTIYPDVIESGAGDAEVRQLGRELGLPEELVMRQPFPGPGLAIRVIGEITWEKLEMLRDADFIFREEVANAGLAYSINQYFAVLTSMRSVGVMGDSRTYDYTLALRGVTTTDFMTADWARIPYDVLDRASARIVNEVRGINRVVYDITSKPPATIEWE